MHSHTKTYTRIHRNKHMRSQKSTRHRQIRTIHSAHLHVHRHMYRPISNMRSKQPLASVRIQRCAYNFDESLNSISTSANFEHSSACTHNLAYPWMKTCEFTKTRITNIHAHTSTNTPEHTHTNTHTHREKKDTYTNLYIHIHIYINTYKRTI